MLRSCIYFCDLVVLLMLWYNKLLGYKNLYLYCTLQFDVEELWGRMHRECELKRWRSEFKVVNYLQPPLHSKWQKSSLPAALFTLYAEAVPDFRNSGHPLIFTACQRCQRSKLWCSVFEAWVLHKVRGNGAAWCVLMCMCMSSTKHSLFVWL